MAYKIGVTGVIIYHCMFYIFITRHKAPVELWAKRLINTDIACLGDLTPLMIFRDSRRVTAARRIVIDVRNKPRDD